EMKNVNVLENQFQITGMTCAACSNRIEKGLKKLDGVQDANVNLALEKATVQFDKDKISFEDIQKKVQDLGYGAVLKNDDGEKETIDYREKEIKKQPRKFILSLILSLPLLWTMASHFSFTSFLYVPKIIMHPWVQMALATPVQFYIGKQFYIGAFKALRNQSANMDVLVVLGTSAAYFYSAFLVIRSIATGNHSMDLYFETSAVLITLIILGKLFEAKAKGRSSQAIKKLMGLQAKTATVVRQEAIMNIPLEEVVIGDMLLVKPGEKVPVDGTIIEGESAFDEAMITGESVPVDKGAGDSVIGATINKNGFIKMK